MWMIELPGVLEDFFKLDNLRQLKPTILKNLKDILIDEWIVYMKEDCLIFLLHTTYF